MGIVKMLTRFTITQTSNKEGLMVDKSDQGRGSSPGYHDFHKGIPCAWVRETSSYFFMRQPCKFLLPTGKKSENIGLDLYIDFDDRLLQQDKNIVLWQGAMRVRRGNTKP